jgi:replicative DNA helicase
LKLYDKLISQKQAVDKSYERLSSNRQREWGLYGLDFGLHALNMAIGGLIPTRLTTIGGRSGSGKTALTAQMFDAGTRVTNNRRCEYLFATWEMEPALLVDRHVCNRTGLTLRMLNQGAKLLDTKTLGRIDSTYREAASLPVYYQTATTDIDTMKALIYEFVDRCKAKSKVEGVEVLPVVVIDYINMAMFDGAGLRTYGIGDFMNGLKQTANATGSAVVVFAQLNRGVDKENRLPDRADFSDSSAIENASDNLIVLHRPEYHNIKTIMNPRTQIEEESMNKMLVRVLKGRDYGIGDFLMNCDVKHFRFWAEDHDWDTPYWKQYSSRDFWINQFGLQQMEIQSHLQAIL